MGTQMHGVQKSSKTERQMVKELKIRNSAAARQHIQSMYNNQKQWNKKILKGDNNAVKLNAVLHKGTNKMLIDPAEIAAYVHGAFQHQARPAHGRSKTRKYLPEESKRDYPWETGAYSNKDPYTLETKTGKPEYGQFSLLDHMRDPSLFHQQMSKLPNRKSPGPDGIPNELLKHLPEDAKQAIHKMFILMWMTGSTPTSWKECRTVLIHKKGDEHDLGKWRPIALANTLYKLWTGMVTQCLVKHAEHYDILSSSQEGFRAETNTIRQLQNLANVLSEAKICQQDMYLLYITFSSAFNTIDHDKLLCIMHDLGFPQDVIEVIADLYTDAVTRIKLDFAVTDLIELGRGTIQGDIPSPILFLIFIEPPS